MCYFYSYKNTKNYDKKRAKTLINTIIFNNLCELSTRVFGFGFFIKKPVISF